MADSSMTSPPNVNVGLMDGVVLGTDDGGEVPSFLRPRMTLTTMPITSAITTTTAQP